MTECKTEQYEFHALGSREVVGHFDGGDITSDAGGLLLREVEQRTGIIRKIRGMFPGPSRSEIHGIHGRGVGGATGLWHGVGI